MRTLRKNIFIFTIISFINCSSFSQINEGSNFETIAKEWLTTFEKKLKKKKAKPLSDHQKDKLIVERIALLNDIHNVISDESLSEIQKNNQRDELGQNFTESTIPSLLTDDQNASLKGKGKKRKKKKQQ